MKKYLVDVFLPASGCHYDVRLPAGKQIDEVILLLVQIMTTLSNGTYWGTEDAMLIDADSGIPFRREQTVHDAGIRNASRLILV